MVPLVIDVQQGGMKLTGRIARNIWYGDDEVTIQFYADAVRQLRSRVRTIEQSAMPRSEEELQCIIKAQCDRVHPYPYISAELKFADWSDSQWHVNVSHQLMNKYYMPKMSNLDQTLLQLNPSRRSRIGSSSTLCGYMRSTLCGYMTRGRCPSQAIRRKSYAASKRWKNALQQKS